MTLVAGVDSSTQSCKVVICDSVTGATVREGSAPHPHGTEVAPQAWWDAFAQASTEAGGLDDVAALSVAGQQHGMVCLDADGEIVRDALLWNDTRSAPDAEDLIRELGGPAQWARAIGSVPVASFTVTKLRWFARHEPELATRTAAVCLPHDWLSWRLQRPATPDGRHELDQLRTDRGDASGTGYWSAASGEYRPDLLDLAFGGKPMLPRVLGAYEPAGTTTTGVMLGPGTGDNAAAALGLDLGPGDVAISIGTSGVVSTISAAASADPSGTITGFADATGRYLPLVCTLNATRVLEATAGLLGVDLDGLSDLALSAQSGADGLVLVPYLDGERTPNRPDATGALHGMRVENLLPANLARAAVEGLLCGLADGLDALREEGLPVARVLLVGGGARSEAVRRIAPAVLGVPVDVPQAGQYVAIGAARQAAWTLAGADGPPPWAAHPRTRYEARPVPDLRDRYHELRDLTAPR